MTKDINVLSPPSLNNSFAETLAITETWYRCPLCSHCPRGQYETLTITEPHSLLRLWLRDILWQVLPLPSEWLVVWWI